MSRVRVIAPAPKNIVLSIGCSHGAWTKCVEGILKDERPARTLKSSAARKSPPREAGSAATRAKRSAGPAARPSQSESWRPIEAVLAWPKTVVEEARANEHIRRESAKIRESWSPGERAARQQGLRHEHGFVSAPEGPAETWSIPHLADRGALLEPLPPLPQPITVGTLSLYPVAVIPCVRVSPRLAHGSRGAAPQPQGQRAVMGDRAAAEIHIA